jgi:hypothetical protein
MSSSPFLRPALRSSYVHGLDAPLSFLVEGVARELPCDSGTLIAAAETLQKKVLLGPLTRNDRRRIGTHFKPYALCRAAAAALFQMSFRSEITISLTPRAIEPPNAVHKARRWAITGPGALASESRKTMYPVMKLEYSA